MGRVKPIGQESSAHFPTLSAPFWPYSAHMDTHKAQNARKQSALSIALADTLRAEMGVARISLRDLSKRSGVPERTLSRLVSGERTIDVTQLDGIAKALELSSLQLLEMAETRARAAEREGPGKGTSKTG